ASAGKLKAEAEAGARRGSKKKDAPAARHAVKQPNPLVIRLKLRGESEARAEAEKARAEAETARAEAEEKEARALAAEKKAREAAEKEAARVAAEKEEARVAAEKEEARVAAEKEPESPQSGRRRIERKLDTIVNNLGMVGQDVKHLFEVLKIHKFYYQFDDPLLGGRALSRLEKEGYGVTLSDLDPRCILLRGDVDKKVVHRIATENKGVAVRP
ncbi:hypothetical protein Tsubulata_031866, partial [Turnera subulata]